MRFGYRPRTIASDIALLAAVPALLAAIHVLLPVEARAALAMHYGRAEPTSLLTAAYVHADATHLLDNVLGYCIGAAFAYGLCLQAGKRRWFRATALSLFVVVPVAVNLGSYALVAWRHPDVAATGLGFSGVVSGFGGFVVVAVLVYLRTRYRRDVVVSVGLLLALLVFLELDVIYAGDVRALPVGLALAGVGVAAYGLRNVRVDDPDVRSDAVVVALVAVALAVFLANLFPRTAVRDGAVVNVFAHAIGFALGAGLAVVTLWLTADGNG